MSILTRFTVIVIYAILQFVCIPLFAQNKFVKYKSDQERNLFYVLDSNKELLKLSLLADIDKNKAEERIDKVDDYIRLLQWSSLDHEKPTKKLKVLFKNIHNSFLRLYDEDVNMNNMFDDGKYNCVTASILYSYIFESIGIPYEIKEEPTHVYVIAYPNKHNIMIETTIPTEGGVFAPKMKEKANYLKTLVQNKYLEQSYVDSLGVEKAFNDFFYGKTNILFKELVGITYYNKGIQFINDAEYEKAYSEMYKANHLYPAKRHEFITQSLLEHISSNLNYESIDNWKILSQIANNSKNKNIKNSFLGQFSIVTDKFLWKSNNKEKLDSIFLLIDTLIVDNTIKKEINELYNYEIARHHANQRKFEDAEKFIEKAYLNNKEAPIIRSFIKENMKHSFSRSNLKKNIEILDYYNNKYSFLENDQDIKGMYIYYYGFIAHEYYRNDSRKEGLKYFQLLIDNIQNFKGENFIPNQVMEELFTLTAGYYVMNNQKQKAKEILATGLKIFPNTAKFSSAIKQIN